MSEERPQDVETTTGAEQSHEGASEGDNYSVTLPCATLSSLIESAVEKAFMTHAPKPSTSNGGEYTYMYGGVFSQAPGCHTVSSWIASFSCPVVSLCSMLKLSRFNCVI